MNKKHAFLLVTALGFALPFVLASCAGSIDNQAQVVLDREERAYDRFKADHALKSKNDLKRAGMYYDGKNFYVVLSLSDAGVDQYPEWAADKLLTSLYGYRALNQNMVSKNEFSNLVLQFEIEEVLEGKYENITRIRLREKDMEKFRKSYREEG